MKLEIAKFILDLYKTVTRKGQYLLHPFEVCALGGCLISLMVAQALTLTLWDTS